MLLSGEGPLPEHLTDVGRVHQADLRAGSGEPSCGSCWTAGFRRRRPSGIGREVDTREARG